MPLTDLIPLLNLPTNPLGWLGLIVMFSVAVIVHELGHLFWAKRFGVGAEEFAVGFGKRLVWREWGGTIYSVRALPLGGFVKIKGMIAALEEEQEEAQAEAKGAQGFVRSAVYESSTAMRDLALWKRLIIFGGGVINNAILAIVLFMALAMFIGVPPNVDIPPVVGWINPGSPADTAGFERGDTVISVNGAPVRSFRAFTRAIENTEGPARVGIMRGGEQITLTWETHPTESEQWIEQLLDTTPALIGALTPNGPAERAGLQPGDLILSVDGVETPHWMDLQPMLAASEGAPVDLEVKRSDEVFTIALVPEFKDYITDQGRWTIGFYPGLPVDEPDPVKYGAGEAFLYGIEKTAQICYLSGEFILRMLTFQTTFQEVSDNTGGPVTIFLFGYQSATSGLGDFIWFAAVLNVILAFFNILPIPILDGGHCLINVIESARRRPIPLRVLERVYFVFFALLVGLMLTLVVKDIVTNIWRLGAG